MEPNTTATQNKRGRPLFIVALLLIPLLAFGGGVATQRLLAGRQATARARPLAVFWEAWDLLEKEHYGDLPTPQQRTYGAIRGVLALLDPYTIFLEPQPSEVEQDRLAGTYGGIGVDLWRDSAGQVVISPFAGSPAERAGVQAGDVLLAVDGQPVADEPPDEVRVHLRGEVSTTVTLTLSRPPDPSFDLVVERAEIQIPSVTYRALDQDPTIGYLHITSFTGRTPDETEEALNALLAGGATSLVLDLRDDGGGLIQPAVEVADLFLDDGVILYEVRRGGEETAREARSGGAASELPLAVLVNNSTASAAEMVAGALQVHRRGILVGEKTFGKGSVQLIFVLSDGSSLHVTSAVWLLPDHQPIGPDGLAPDMEVSRTDELRDAQLDRAVRYLQTGE